MGLSRGKSALVHRLRNPRFRPKEGLFLVEGVRGGREVLEASHPLRIRFTLVSPRLESTSEGRNLLAELNSGSVPVHDIPDQELEGLSDTSMPQGLLMVVEEPRGQLKTLEEVPHPRLLLMDGIQDPGNAGTLIRAARAWGVDAVIALDGTVDPWNPKAVRSAAGAFAHTLVLRCHWAEVEGWLEERGIPLFLADPAGEDVRRFHPDPPWALAVGNEGSGPRAELFPKAKKVLAIPMVPGAESINAGVAGAILLFSLGGSLDTEPED